MTDPLLKASDAGHAVFVDDCAAGKFFGAYAAAKAASRAFVEAYRAECARTGPRISVFHPNPMPTALRARFHPGENTSDLAKPQKEAARLLEECGLGVRS
jgi:NAD(P)-dependent dehydrogenase (short-subunit alcohol dehydrogenase family)